MLLTACAPALSPTAAPTQTLIPPTATASLPDPVLAAPSPTAEVAIPAAAQASVRLALEQLASALAATPAEVTVVSVDAATWTGDSTACDPGERRGYRIMLLVNDATYAYRADTTGGVHACDEALVAGRPPTASADPLADELVLMAQQRLAEELDLSTRRIRLVSIEPRTWTDTSMNCPSPDTTYEAARVSGYRLVLAAGEQQYIFHSDFDRLLACSPEQEVSPESTPEALAP